MNSIVFALALAQAMFGFAPATSLPQASPPALVVQGAEQPLFLGRMVVRASPLPDDMAAHPAGQSHRTERVGLRP
ncbi:hypothetical protein NT2_01_06290 [Caenibius tardaugens NBRC 16725]|uniref:Uncharacterized protein n=1 Tax=Caenibius tardaugens NBRC 16725 TaxID=1219035 RepID=U2YI06_9SPHN|nr:hypothetical protein [Caenibius tardaugens]AZI36935.1 hypothetical protein EGO55_14000 [Caenibius tardaugens NBRC 16725]GAD47855.1 hypothetical protein NT2_01_06290 [Caenibius tardaugens NBRC 16725]